MEGVTDSVASLVRRIVERDPCAWYCLGEGIANLSAMARVIAARIRDETGVEPSIAAVKMALSRLSRARSKGRMLEDIARVIGGSTIVIQDRVAVATIPREELPRLLEEAGDLLRARFFQVTQSLRVATIVLSEEDLPRLRSVYPDADVIEGQAAIVLISPEEIVETPGVVALITNYLAYHGINITQIISCSLDTIIVLDSRDVSRAFTALHQLISSMAGLAGVAGREGQKSQEGE
ncbi:MAG: ACT domain-containing protein [Desulfurococcales archaeon]|nr:ACT domain-containing protein [Desulfurococcales archaeon]